MEIFPAKNKLSNFFLIKVGLMTNLSTLDKLQQQLCELKLEERRVRSDIKNLVRKNSTIDFFQAKQLNSLRTGVKSRIKSVESKIMPNIIA